MTAPQFFVDGWDAAIGTVSLSPEDSRHALRSLRLQAGEEVIVADGRGAVGHGRLTEERGGRAVIALDWVRRVVRRAPVISVAVAPPKGERLSWAIQKLSELGVDEVVLMRTERSVRAWEPDRAERAADRQRAVAREAAMQSRQPFVMKVVAGMDLDEALDTGRDPTIILSEGMDHPLTGVLPAEATGLRLLIGPEGGFTDDELERAAAAGAQAASLGAPVLRTETAVLVAATLAMNRYGRLG